MRNYNRILIALAILLSGLVLFPQVTLLGGTVNWQRFQGIYGDTVTVTRARYDDDDQELEVRATSSSAQATLSVYETSTGQFIGTLTNEGDEHRGEFQWPRDPGTITVRSSLGGHSTVLVQDGSGDPPTVTPSVTRASTATLTPTRTPTSTVKPTESTSPTVTVTPTTGADARRLYLPVIYRRP
ncbi:MAG TPA: hypothetical protein VF625_06535 [Longimicrobium sp.]|jgi:hypothetical protein